MSNPSAHRIYFGKVLHVRLAPFTHRFVYRVFSILLDLDALQRPSLPVRGFSINRLNLLSFYDKDHGSGRPGDLRRWVGDRLASAGIITQPTKVLLLCYPRILGYVFNPLSVYYCYAADGKLMALIYEVANTFGEKHCYVGDVATDRCGQNPVSQTALKVFHVSPFLPVEGTYDFRFNDPDDRLKLSIQHRGETGPRLHTRFDGVGRTLDSRSIARAFLSYPLMTLKVIGAIHFEALRLWRKGAKFHSKPALPDCSQSEAQTLTK